MSCEGIQNRFCNYDDDEGVEGGGAYSEGLLCSRCDMFRKQTNVAFAFCLPRESFR